MKADKVLKFVLQIIGLILINKAGFYIVELMNLRIPGNVLGMILLFLLLWMRVVRLEWFEGAADFFVRHLSFFFVPVSVGLMTLGGLIAENGIQLAIILVLSAIVGMAFAGVTSNVLIKRKGGEEAGNSAHDL